MARLTFQTLLAFSALLSVAVAIVPSLGLDTVGPIRAEIDDAGFAIRFEDSMINETPGFTTSAATYQTFPALAGTDVQTSVVQVDLPAGNSFPRHIHPRAGEVLILLAGEMDFSFSFEGNPDTSRLVTNSLVAGNAAIVPEGLLHVATCTSEEDCRYIQVTNSADPGAVFV